MFKGLGVLTFTDLFIGSNTLFLVFLLSLLGMALFASYQLHFAFRHFKMKQLISAPTMLNQLPSVSVCIPARNETHAMAQCLERVIASTYPKLEIIVLDDSSVDNTSYLIKSFAHAGVRFVEGSALPPGWLGKNYALQGLLDEASGSYVLYMDVDTLLAPDSIEQLVAYAEQEKAHMISVLPQRADGPRVSVLFSPLRYYWTLLFHRPQAPAVASGAWMIRRQVLQEQLGGFSKHQQDIQPETHFAASLNAQHAYRFLIGTPQLGVTYEKKWRSQIDTSIRLLAPLVGVSPLRVIGVSLGLLMQLIPLVLVMSAGFVGWTRLPLLGIGSLIVYMMIYGSYLHHVWRHGWILGAMLWPVIIVQEGIVLIMSFIHYARRTVTWKGRPILARSTTSPTIQH